MKSRSVERQFPAQRRFAGFAVRNCSKANRHWTFRRPDRQVDTLRDGRPVAELQLQDFADDVFENDFFGADRASNQTVLRFRASARTTVKPSITSFTLIGKAASSFFDTSRAGRQRRERRTCLGRKLWQRDDRSHDQRPSTHSPPSISIAPKDRSFADAVGEAVDTCVGFHHPFAFGVF